MALQADFLLRELESKQNRTNLKTARVIYLYVRRKIDKLEQKMKRKRSEHRDLLITRRNINHAADALFHMEEDVRRGDMRREDLVAAAVDIANQQQLWQREGRPRLSELNEEMTKLEALRASWRTALAKIKHCLDKHAYNFVQVRDSIMRHRHSRGSGFVQAKQKGGRITFIYGGNNPDNASECGRAIFDIKGHLIHSCEPFSFCGCQLALGRRGVSRDTSYQLLATPHFFDFILQ